MTCGCRAAPTSLTGGSAAAARAAVGAAGGGVERGRRGRINVLPRHGSPLPTVRPPLSRRLVCTGQELGSERLTRSAPPRRHLGACRPPLIAAIRRIPVTDEFPLLTRSYLMSRHDED